MEEALLADGTTGRKLAGKLQSLGQSHPMVPQILLLSPMLHWLDLMLLSLDQCHPMVPRLLLLSPLLHLRHLVLLSLGQCHRVVLQSTPQARRVMSHLAVGINLECNS